MPVPAVPRRLVTLAAALDYETPAPAGPAGRWRFFVGGAVTGVLISIVLLSILRAGGPIFPFTVLFAPVAVVVEIVGGGRALYLGLFVGGPLLYGLYALPLVLPNRARNLSIACGAHLMCFAITLWQRAVFSVL